jgi:hypothetical protein
MKREAAHDSRAPLAVGNDFRANRRFAIIVGGNVW